MLIIRVANRNIQAHLCQPLGQHNSFLRFQWKDMVKPHGRSTDAMLTSGLGKALLH